MPAGVLIIGALVAGSPAITPTTLTHSVRPRLPVVVVAPSGNTTVLGLSETLQRIASVWEAKTPLAIEPVDEARVRGCEGRLECMAQAGADAQLMLVVSVLPVADGDLVDVVVIDPQRALRVPRGEAAEAWIAQHAALGPPVQRTIRRREDLVTLIERSLTQAREGLHSRKLDLVFGAVQVTTGPETLVALGRHQAHGATLWRQVPAGTHALSVETDGVRSVREVRVEPGQTTHITLSAAATGEYAALRQGTLWGSALVAGAGVAVLAVGAAQSPDPSACWSACEGGAVRLGGAAGPGPLDDPNGSGPAALPLGASLTAFGLGAGVSTLLIGDDDDLPWIPWLIGAVAAGAAAGISVAAQ